MAKEDANKVDERPLTHITDRSASAFRQSEHSVGGAKMFSASASNYDPDSALNRSSAKAGSRSKSRTGGEAGHVPFSTSAKRTTEPAMWQQSNTRNVGPDLT